MYVNLLMETKALLALKKSAARHSYLAHRHAADAERFREELKQLAADDPKRPRLGRELRSSRSARDHHLTEVTRLTAVFANQQLKLEKLVHRMTILD